MAAPVRLSRGVPAPEPLPPAGVTGRPLEERRDMSAAPPTAEPALRARPAVPLP